MLKIKPEFWTRNGRERFVVLSMEDFEKIQERIEDAGLSRILREARRKEADAPTVSHDEIMRRLGIKPPPKRKARRSRSPPVPGSPCLAGPTRGRANGGGSSGDDGANVSVLDLADKLANRIAADWRL